MLGDLLRAKIDYFLYDLFWILVSRQLIDFFLYARLIWEVGVDIGSRNVSEGLNFLALLCELHHTLRPKVIDLQGVK